MRTKQQMLDMISDAQRALKPRTVTPATTIEQLMYDAGIEFALTFINNLVMQGASDTVQVQAPAEMPSDQERALRTMFSGNSL